MKPQEIGSEILIHIAGLGSHLTLQQFLKINKIKPSWIICSMYIDIWNEVIFKYHGKI